MFNSAPGSLEFEERKSLAGRCILVVDADEDVWRLANSILAPLGCLVDWANSGERACDWIRRFGLSRRYDVIMAALNLPDMTGVDLYLRLQEQMDRVPIALVCSFGFDPGPRLAQARHFGIHTPLFYPFRRDQLLRTVEQFVGAAP